METTAASIWDKWNNSGGPKYPHAKIIQYVFRNFPAAQRPNTNVLDLGCGSGVHLWFLGREGFKTYGMDISPTGVENARAWLQRDAIPYQELKACVVSDLDYEHNFFDLIICCGVIECVDMEEAKRMVNTTYALLKPGGAAVFIFMSDKDFRMQLAPSELSLHGYTPEEVRELFSMSAWTSCDIDRYITTFQNETMMSNDFLVTLKK